MMLLSWFIIQALGKKRNRKHFHENASIFVKIAAWCMHSLRSHTYQSDKRKN